MESKMMVKDQTVWKEKRVDVGSNEGFHGFVYNWKQAYSSIIGSQPAYWLRGSLFIPFVSMGVMLADFQA